MVAEDNASPYRWLIVVAGICGLFASLGIGRFALGMLLPAMGEALNLSYAEMGGIGTVNFCGYLLAVLFCGKLSRRYSPRLLISLALLAVGLSMISIGVTEQLPLITLFYFLTGVGSALSNVPIMALIAIWFPPTSRGRAAGLVVIGNGLGIIVAGYLVPTLNSGGYGWQMSWITLGSLVCCAAVICLLLIRNKPSELKTAQREKTSAVQQETITATHGLLEKRFEPIFAHCAAIYFLFGFTYVIYTTFFVTSLVQERGFTEHQAGHLWSWVGFLSLVSGPLFGSLSDRFGRRAGLVSVFSIQAAAYTMAVSALPEGFLYASIFCFGVVAWSVPTIMAALVGDLAGPERAAAVFGFVTFVFGIGQVAGPFCAGALAEMTGGFALSFLLAMLLAVSAAALSFMLPGAKRSGKRL